MPTIIRDKHGHNTWKDKPLHVSEFLDIVLKITDEWNDDDEGELYPWFRGVNDTSYSLLPGTYRKKIQEEGEIFNEFKLKALPYLGDSYINPVSKWDWYFMMQHYGAPTRLLDWTEGALTALYFAVRPNLEKELESDAAVWMLDPYFLNKKIGFRDNYIRFIDDNDLEKFLPVVYGDRRLPNKIVPLGAGYLTKRIAAQKGAFTIHGSRPTPLEGIPAIQQRLIKIHINWDDKKQIQKELFIAGIAETTVYPELSALSKDLIYYWTPDEGS